MELGSAHRVVSRGLWQHLFQRSKSNRDVGESYLKLGAVGTADGCVF